MLLRGSVVLLLVGLGQCLSALTPVNPRTYKINLDTAPEKRWLEVAKDFPGAMTGMRKAFTEFIPAFTIPIFETIAAGLEKYLPSQYAQEIRGLASAFNASLGDVVIPNILYDVLAHCTSIVSQDAKGRIWHSRNLDYGMTDFMRTVTINVHFTRGGKVVYSATTFPGYVGIITGQKPQAFTLTLNQREKGSSWIYNFLIGILDRKAKLVGFLFRETLENSLDFSSALDTLCSTHILAPSYFILGGVKADEGAIITRDRLSVADLWRIDSANNRWFLVETNYDHWMPAPPNDNRRTPANNLMNQTGMTNLSTDSLFRVLSTPPILNRGTVHTTVMSASQADVFRSWVWRDSTALLP